MSARLPTGVLAGHQQGLPTGLNPHLNAEYGTEGRLRTGSSGLLSAGVLTGKHEQVLAGPDWEPGIGVCRTADWESGTGVSRTADAGQLRLYGAELLTEPSALGAMDTTPLGNLQYPLKIAREVHSAGPQGGSSTFPLKA